MIGVCIPPVNSAYSRVHYVLQTFSSVMGEPFVFYEDGLSTSEIPIRLAYGSRPQYFKGVFIPMEDYDSWLADTINKSEVDGLTILTTKLPPFLAKEKHDNGIDFTFDLISASFFLLSRQEELLDSKRDIWGCFTGYQSKQRAWGILESPIVNLYLQTLQEALEDVFGKDAFRFCPSLWPNEKSFAVALMHDVDQPFRGDMLSAKRLTKSALKRFPVGIRKAGTLALRGIIKQITGGKDPYFNFQKYMDTEEIFGFRSSFNLVAIPEQRGIMVRYDPSYDLNHPYVRMALDEVKGRGFEIGIHISYLAAENRDLMKEELSYLKKVAGREILGGSLHYLRLQVNRTWEYLSDIGLTYDTSMGYNEALGFRAGWAHPYLPYSFDQKRALPILSLPLVIMDGVLFDTERLSIHEATSYCLKLLEEVKLRKGMAVILWHLRTLDNKDYPGWGEVYNNILEYLSCENVWVTSPGEIASWWLSRIESIKRKEICAA